ncbi:erythrocyte membrane protein 1, PfEMP1 [Plasmodium sp. gorilla clade G1]|nr:erythrocyte membrane protein 1, PfEMP1 [Plasmodium sp. gorilla clade G1]
MAALGRGAGGVEEDAKNMFDRIGKEVHDQVKEGGAETYKDELKGSLSQVSTNSETSSTQNPCTFDYDKHTTVANGNTKPCGKDGKEDAKRFSKERGAECDEKKIEGNTKNYGACAPYRRLSLCNKNMVKMDTNNNDSKAKHDLLADVCMAAKFEGESLIPYREQYDEIYEGSGSTMCTMLARSFADIGDIVRGRDLYSGNKKKNQKETEREKLEEKLKGVFGKIYEELSKKGAQTHYNDPEKNYYQLREDWWTANRETVWKAITCDDKLASAHYFRPTCSDSEHSGSFSQAKDHCRCPNGDKPNVDPPTYFDYVPQYLRWFEEWTEDFCRKKKKKLENVKNKCRGKYGEDGKDRYCSLNGCDCTKTVRAKGKLRYGNRCTDCLYACNSYVEWIDKQGIQFDKQKNKYTKEITGGGSGRKKRGTITKVYDGYEKKFYGKLKEGKYGTVNKFLDLLSKEKECENIKDDKGGKLDFNEHKDDNNEYKGTFYHSEYCQPCPFCGMKKKRQGKGWEKKKDDDKCTNGNLYKPKKDANSTPIRILKSGERPEDIKQKIDEFCTKYNNDNSDSSLYDEWKCYKGKDVEKVVQKDEDEEEDDDDYQNVLNSGGLCILQNKNNKERKENETNYQKEPAEFQKTFYDFFTYWVAHMLKDSIHWRTKKLEKCLQTGNAMKCKNGCNTKCDCFLKWITQKKSEWDKIKDHFYKQENIGSKGVFDAGMTPDFVLQYNLEQEFLKGDSEEKSSEDNQNNLDADEAKELKHLQKMLKEEESQETAVDADGKKKTIMDRLIEHELKDAETCKNCQDPQRPAGGDVDRSDTFTPHPPSEYHDSSEDEDDADGDDQQEETAVADTETDVMEEVEVPAATDTSVEVCKIVGAILTKDNLKDACTLKYVTGKNYGWKCVSTTSDKGSESARGAEPTRDSAVTTTGKDGAICVPPRRRRLYVGGLSQWADKVETQVGEAQTPLGDGASTETPESSLLHAFIESAAVETFFLWDRYKKENTKKPDATQLLSFGTQAGGMSVVSAAAGQAPHLPQLSGLGVLGGAGIPSSLLQNGGLGVGGAGGLGVEPQALGGVGIPGGVLPEGGAPGGLQELKLLGGGTVNGGEQTPEQELQKGHIPPDFLRLMFYTLGDYRDICIGGDRDIVGDTIYKDTSDKDKEGGVTKKISEKIEQILSKLNDTHVPEKPVQTPQTWWDTNAQHIWNGMICALTYRDSEQKGDGGKPTQDPTVKSALLDNNKPKNGNDYNSVKLEEETSGAKSTSAPASGARCGEKTTLTDFISRPPYFRWLEEWGETFCHERKKRLEKIKEECKVETDSRRDGKKNPKCSCYGEDCEEIFSKKYDTVSSLECPDCAKYCRFYKRWIDRKRKEYDKQENIYVQQKSNYENEQKKGAGRNNDDKQFCVIRETCDTAGDFLEKLKNGPCKKDNDSEEDNKGNGYIDFNDKEKTFGHETYCDPCSKFTVKCKGTDHCDKSKGNGCNGITDITKDNIETNENFTQEVTMLVSDNSTTEFEDLKDACGSANIFKSIRKDQWKCRNVCGYVVCGLKGDNGQKVNEKHIIQIRALLRLWVAYFLDDYNKIKNKISHCTKNSEVPTCINGCVEQWITRKKEEWQQIKERFNDQYKSENSGDTFPVRSFLETSIPQIPVANVKTDQEKVIKLSKFDNSCGCSADANAQKDSNQDAIECMLKKLEDKITSCKKKHTPSDQNQTCENSTPVEDEDDTLDEETEEVKAPNICPEQQQQPQPVDEGKCVEDSVPDVKEEEEEKEEEKDKGDEEKEAASGPAGPPPLTPEAPKKDEKVPKPKIVKPKPQNPLDAPLTPALKKAMLSNTIMWSVGIGFAAFTYFFLKKKTKSSVGNLFQILQIPKGDYDIPTLKSSNRYIPYASDRYKGKTYIYMEGDSSGDEKYAFMSDTTDVTSSESEYEELDINDIYVPGSPKYKTLIELVLEPSKRDIQSDDTPSNKFTDNEWNQLKKYFISNMLQNTQNTEPNILHDNVDNNTHPTMSRLNVDQKPFIMSIHDRNLYIGQEYSYDMSTNSGNNDLYSGIDPTSANHDSYSDNHHPYSGIDLINDALNGDYDIYDEILKRKENELFGTNHTKHTTTNIVTKLTNSDPILNQINLFHKWLDRHRDMCEKWDKNKMELLDKLKEVWNKENNNNSAKTYNSDNKPSGNKTLNTDVSIQIDMDNPKTKNEFKNMDTTPNKSTMDTMLDDLEKYNEPYYYDFYEYDIYYDVNDDDKTSMDNNNNLVDKNNPVDSNSSTYNHHNPADINKTFVDINNHNQHPIEKPTKIQIEMNSNNREVVEQQYPISDIWNI